MDQDEAREDTEALIAALEQERNNVRKQFDHGMKLAREQHERDKMVIAELESKLADAHGALKPLAVLQVPNRPQGNAGAYSIRHADIERAQAALASNGAEAAAVLEAAVDFEPITRRTAMPGALEALLTRAERAKLFRLQQTVDAYLAKRGRT